MCKWLHTFANIFNSIASKKTHRFDSKNISLVKSDEEAQRDEIALRCLQCQDGYTPSPDLTQCVACGSLCQNCSFMNKSYVQSVELQILTEMEALDTQVALRCILCEEDATPAGDGLACVFCEIPSCE